MRFEHLALNVAEPKAMAAWYCQHLGLRVRRALPDQAQTHFLVDDSDQMMLEIYCNPADQVPDYPNMHPLLLHLALVSVDPYADSKRLQQAGAQQVDEVNLADGSLLVMLRDPWGLALQLCRRGAALNQA
ncbi:VOC family protein [Rheinheimera sp. MM224]|uniref:VOC family protein n=1 Tax=Rheinheimera sp. MM224 TaxID=3019969 RepID=UPI0021F8A825|nr:VOC family protein [Rheinheimera sp. MM224]CAI3793622.1 hypothetical protein JAMGFMIE_00855 [Rheinheimera sp. MM224]